MCYGMQSNIRSALQSSVCWLTNRFVTPGCHLCSQLMLIQVTQLITESHGCKYDREVVLLAVPVELRLIRWCQVVVEQNQVFPYWTALVAGSVLVRSLDAAPLH